MAEEKEKKKSKKGLIIALLLIIIIIAVAVTAVVLMQNNSGDEKSKEEAGETEIDWQETYIAILEDEENFEDMEDTEIQLADLDEDEIPELIVYGTDNIDEFVAKIYTLADSGDEAEEVIISSEDNFEIKYLYNKQEEANNWYYVSNGEYAEFELTEDDYNLEETDYKKSNFTEVDDTVNERVEFDPTASTEEIEEVFESVKSNYVEISAIKTKIPEASTADDEEIQIAVFVEYDGYTYYWELTDESRDSEGIYGSYSYASGVENTLVRMPETGEKETVYEGEGFGEIAIVNDRIYTYVASDADSTSYCYVMSMDLDGENVEVYDDECLEMKTVSGDLIICESTHSSDDLYSINTETDEITKIVSDVDYLGTYKGIVYYALDYYTEYQSSKEKYLKIGTITDGVDNGISSELPMSIFEDNAYEDVSNYEIFDFLGYDEYVYVRYGWKSGSAYMIQDEAVSRISIEDGTIEDSYTIESGEAAEGTGDALASIYLYENSEGTYVMIASKIGINVDTFEKVTVDDDVEKYVGYNVGACLNSSSNTVDYIEELTRENITILTQEYLTSHDFDFSSDEYYTNVFAEAETDEYIYVIVDQGLHNSEHDSGWRYSYDRTKTLAIKYNKETEKVVLLYEFK